MTSPRCGAQFELRYNNQKFCSNACCDAERKSRRRNHSDEHLLAEAWRAATPVCLDSILSKPRKPEGVSDVRWRIELRRRANPEHYEMASLAV